MTVIKGQVATPEAQGYCALVALLCQTLNTVTMKSTYKN